MEGQESIPKALPEGKSLRKESEDRSLAVLPPGSPSPPEKGPGALLGGESRPHAKHLAENDISLTV